jgi:hypothetical protein
MRWTGKSAGGRAHASGSDKWNSSYQGSGSYSVSDNMAFMGQTYQLNGSVTESGSVTNGSDNWHGAQKWHDGDWNWPEYTGSASETEKRECSYSGKGKFSYEIPDGEDPYSHSSSASHDGKEEITKSKTWSLDSWGSWGQPEIAYSGTGKDSYSFEFKDVYGYTGSSPATYHGILSQSRVREADSESGWWGCPGGEGTATHDVEQCGGCLSHSDESWSASPGGLNLHQSGACYVMYLGGLATTMRARAMGSLAMMICRNIGTSSTHDPLRSCLSRSPPRITTRCRCLRAAAGAKAV